MRSTYYPNQKGMQYYPQNDQSPYFDPHFVIDGITFDYSGSHTGRERWADQGGGEI